jgi:hypothetical protein
MTGFFDFFQDHQEQKRGALYKRKAPLFYKKTVLIP